MMKIRKHLKNIPFCSCCYDFFGLLKWKLPDVLFESDFENILPMPKSYHLHIFLKFRRLYFFIEWVDSTFQQKFSVVLSEA